MTGPLASATEWLSAAGVLAGGYLAFHFVHYSAHRWFAHRQIVDFFHRAHARGHHRVYEISRYATPGPYNGLGEGVWIDFIAPIPVMAAACLLLPRELFVLLAVEVAVLGWFFTWAHRSFHIEGHFLKRWLSQADRLHEHHHRDPSKNYGFGFHGFDRLFYTFAEPSGESPEQHHGQDAAREGRERAHADPAHVGAFGVSPNEARQLASNEPRDVKQRRQRDVR